jgi:hypothetical protein
MPARVATGEPSGRGSLFREHLEYARGSFDDRPGVARLSRAQSRASRKERAAHPEKVGGVPTVFASQRLELEGALIEMKINALHSFRGARYQSLRRSYLTSNRAGTTERDAPLFFTF